MLRRSNNQEKCENLCFMRQYKGYDVGISRAGGKITCRVIAASGLTKGILEKVLSSITFYKCYGHRQNGYYFSNDDVIP